MRLVKKLEILKSSMIPISYSRKFEGLYKSLNYDYVVNGKTETFLEGGTKNYEELRNIPKLNGVAIRGEKTL